MLECVRIAQNNNRVQFFENGCHTFTELRIRACAKAFGDIARFNRANLRYNRGKPYMRATPYTVTFFAMESATNAATTFSPCTVTIVTVVLQLPQHEAF